MGLIGNVGIIVAVATYVGSEKQRRAAEVLNAWQTITNTYGQAGSGGRIQALEFLNASPGANWRRKFPWFCAPLPPCTWPAENLAGVNLTADLPEKAVEEKRSAVTRKLGDERNSVYLDKIQLPNAFLSYAKLENAILGGANLENADLFAANLENTDLSSANLKGADSGSANLKGALLSSANFEGALLQDSNLEGASLRDANLKGANLGSANLKGTDLGFANLEGVKKLEADQIMEAKLCFTELPAAIDLPANRDCSELGFDSETGKYIGLPGRRLVFPWD